MAHQRTQQSREIKKRRKLAQLNNYSISCCSTKEHLLWQIDVIGGFRERVRANDVKMILAALGEQEEEEEECDLF